MKFNTKQVQSGSFTGSFTGSFNLPLLSGTSSLLATDNSGNIVFYTGSLTFNTSSLVSLTTFNSFTSSYNTGSFSGSFTGSLQGTASWALNSVSSISSSYALSSSYAFNSTSASYSLNSLSASYALSSSYALVSSTATSASYALNSNSASYSLNSLSASYSLNSTSASYSLNANSSSYSLSSSYAFNSTTASYSLIGLSASYSLNSTSASYSLNATSASYALNVNTSSLTASFFVQGGNSFGTSALLGTLDSQGLLIGTSGLVRMTITSTGEVLIGNGLPISSSLYKLQVSGTILIADPSATSSINIGGHTNTGGYTNTIIAMKMPNASGVERMINIDNASNTSIFSVINNATINLSGLTVQSGGGLRPPSTGWSIQGAKAGTFTGMEVQWTTGAPVTATTARTIGWWMLQQSNQITGTNQSITLVLTGSISQSVAASGSVVRGLFVDSSIINVAGQYRAIETTNGDVTLNTITGSTYIGSPTAMTSSVYTLQVSGSSYFKNTVLFNGVGSYWQTAGAGFGRIISSGTGIDIGHTAAGTHILITAGNNTSFNQICGFANSVNITPGGNQPLAALVVTSGSNAGAVNANLLRVGNNSLIVSGSTANVLINTTTDLGYRLNVSGSIFGQKYNAYTGSNASIGRATLVAGNVLVSTNQIFTSSSVFVSRVNPGGTLGDLYSPDTSIVNATSFAISSSNIAETSTVNWWIIN